MLPVMEDNWSHGSKMRTWTEKACWVLSSLPQYMWPLIRSLYGGGSIIYFMCKFIGVGNILHTARKCLAGNKSVALMCKAVECTLNSTTVLKHFMKFFHWCNFHLCMPFSSCEISFLIIVFTQNILASTLLDLEKQIRFLAYSLKSRIYWISISFSFLFSVSGKSTYSWTSMNSEVMQWRKADVFILQFLCILPIDVYKYL